MIPSGTFWIGTFFLLYKDKTSLSKAMHVNYHSNLIRTVCLKVNGSQSDKDERFKASQYVSQLKVSKFISLFVHLRLHLGLSGPSGQRLTPVSVA